MKIVTARDAEADDLLRDAGFRAEWLRLAGLCPWATAFQGPDFGHAWYASYRERYEPLLVQARAADGALAGLLPLAVGREDQRELVVAGAGQAEYHAWINSPEAGDEFPAQAIRWLQGAFPHSLLKFQYLPPGTPQGWLSGTGPGANFTIVTHRRPLLHLGPAAEAEKFLRNKSDKSKFNRLKKIGPVGFRRITDAAGLEAALNEVSRFCDFRHAALHGVAPFRADPAKRQFHLRMVEYPGLLHATALTVGDRIIAAHLGVSSAREVHLGVTAYDPFLTKLSPGKFLIHFLADRLRAEGYERLDLTPGGDAYKERFANDNDEVAALTLPLGPGGRARAAAPRAAIRGGRRLLKVLRVDPQRVRSLGARLRRVGPVGTAGALVRRGRRWLGSARELRVYAHDAAGVADGAEDDLIRRDALEDLLTYEAVEGSPTSREFLSGALARIEAGAHVYTSVADGRLAHWGWLAERQETSFLSEVRTGFTFPPNSACLYDFYTHPHYRGRGLYTRSLRRMLRDAARVPGTEKVYIFVLADNIASRKVIEKAGFRYEGSLFEAVRFGQARRWAEGLEGGQGGDRPKTFEGLPRGVSPDVPV